MKISLFLSALVMSCGLANAFAANDPLLRVARLGRRDTPAVEYHECEPMNIRLIEDGRRNLGLILNRARTRIEELHAFIKNKQVPGTPINGRLLSTYRTFVTMYGPIQFGPETPTDSIEIRGNMIKAGRRKVEKTLERIKALQTGLYDWTGYGIDIWCTDNFIEPAEGGFRDTRPEGRGGDRMLAYDEKLRCFKTNNNGDVEAQFVARLESLQVNDYYHSASNSYRYDLIVLCPAMWHQWGATLKLGRQAVEGPYSENMPLHQLGYPEGKVQITLDEICRDFVDCMLLSVFAMSQTLLKRRVTGNEETGPETGFAAIQKLVREKGDSVRIKNTSSFTYLVMALHMEAYSWESGNNGPTLPDVVVTREDFPELADWRHIV